ncbi:hypothetical protein [Amycolatopsis sp. RTGN1]|uniref:hypothetical protein n=1 Tax=Amycolatopsis ponsaeliensis TaxID=2992142 RepID=UPI00254B6C6F|nr:hypothetical protein [Amycolatopsis sp. RTGN1]
MTTTELPIADADKRFVLGPPLGWTPTSEPVSDTDVTPFGLTLRTAPNRIDIRAKKDPTQAVSEITSDGSGEDEDVRFDVTDD